MNYYAGIGSRQTPEDVLKIIKTIGSFMVHKDYILRSGAADGADTAFEQGCDAENGKKEIYLPWAGFNRNPSELSTPSQEAFDLAEKTHPEWEFLRHSAKKLHARNSHQIFGQDMKTPVKLVICWSKGKGGTEQALRIARINNIPIVNLYDLEDMSTCFDLINEIIKE